MRSSATCWQPSATLLITHRLTGLEEVDEVVVLDHGAIVERGTHDDLLTQHGRYAASWQRELGNGGQT